MPPPKRNRNRDKTLTTVEEQIADAEIRALLAEDAITIGPDGEPIVRMPWANVVARLHRGWPEHSEERDDAESVLKWVARGSYREVAFHRSGLRPSLNTTWQARARKGDKRYQLLCDLMDQADAVAESQALSLIERASRRDWRAAAWFLERRNPERWGTGALRSPVHAHMSSTKDPRFNGQAPAAALVGDHSAGSAPLLPPLPPSEFDAPDGEAGELATAVEPASSTEPDGLEQQKAAE